MKAENLRMVGVYPPPSYRQIENILGTDCRAQMDMLDSGLGDELARVFGKHDGVVPGRNRQWAQAFFFEFQEQTLIAVCEKGDTGSSWYWAHHVNPYSFDAGDPEVASFWPDFVEALFEIRGKRMSDELVGLMFGEESLPAQRRKAKQVCIEIAEAMQDQAKPLRVGPRL